MCSTSAGRSFSSGPDLLDEFSTLLGPCWVVGDQMDGLIDIIHTEPH